MAPHRCPMAGWHHAAALLLLWCGLRASTAAAQLLRGRRGDPSPSSLASFSPMVPATPAAAGAWGAVQPLYVWNASAVHTMEGAAWNETAEAFCVHSGRFTAVGAADAVRRACGPDAASLDMRGAAVVPGLIDSHAHLMYMGFKLFVAQLDSCTSANGTTGTAAVAASTGDGGGDDGGGGGGGLGAATAAAAMPGLGLTADVQAQAGPSVVETLLEYVRSHPVGPGEWLQGFGWDQNRWGMDVVMFPTRQDLDGAFPSTPVWLTRIDGHAAWANSAAMRAVPGGIPAQDPEGGTIKRDPATGEPTGIFMDNAMAIVADAIPAPSPAVRREMLRLVLADCAANGLTSVTDPGIDPANVPLFMEAIDAGNFSLRLNAMWLGVSNDLGPAATPATPMIHGYSGAGRANGSDPRLSVRAVKFFMDGALGSWGAAMLQPYSDRPDQSGQLRMTAEEYDRNVSEWVRAGYQVATHAIGDRANRIVIDSYVARCDEAVRRGRARALERIENVGGANNANSIATRDGGGGTGATDGGEQDAGAAAVAAAFEARWARREAAGDLRLRIEHFQIVNETDIPRIHTGGDPGPAGGQCILASMQPTHATGDMGFALQRLGAARLQGAYAWRSVLNTSVAALPLGSDFPTVGTVPPLLGIFAAVTRTNTNNKPTGGWLPAQKLTPTEAVRGYTRDAAFASFDEADLGGIAVGKLADWVALDRDVLRGDPRDIWSTTVLATYVGGASVFEHDCFRRDGAAAPFQCPVVNPYDRVQWGGDGCPHGHAGHRHHAHTHAHDHR